MIVCSNPSDIISEEEANIGKLPKCQVGDMSTNEEQKLKCVRDLVRQCWYVKLENVSIEWKWQIKLVWVDGTCRKTGGQNMD